METTSTLVTAIVFVLGSISVAAAVGLSLAKHLDKKNAHRAASSRTH